MGHLLNHADLGEVQRIVYLTAIVISTDSGLDTMEFTGIGDCPNASAVPVFYHCKDDVEKRTNGALEGGSGAFAKDDEVIVQCEITSGGAYLPLFVVGFTDKPKSCCFVDDSFDKFDEDFWNPGGQGSFALIQYDDFSALEIDAGLSSAYIAHPMPEAVDPIEFTYYVRTKTESTESGAYGIFRVRLGNLHPALLVFTDEIRVYYEGGQVVRAGSYFGRWIEWRFVLHENGTFDTYENDTLVFAGLQTRIDVGVSSTAIQAINHAIVTVDKVSVCPGLHPPEGV